MADAKKVKAKETANGASAEERKGPPAGFRRRSAVSDAPWFTNKEGNIAHGKLIGRYIMQGVEPPRPYYQVELYSSATVTVGRGDDAEEREASAGEVINVGESYKLKCLIDVEIPEILAGADYDVWIEVDKKIKVGQGRTMWMIDVQSKRTKSPTGEVRPLPKEALGGEEGEASDSPF
jgi:hypothetical protein